MDIFLLESHVRILHISSCDANQPILANMTVQDSILKKKPQSILYIMSCVKDLCVMSGI